MTRTNLKRAVSVSLGSSARDKSTKITLFDQPVAIERCGTDGSTARASTLFTAMDGRVDALGVGGIDLWVDFENQKYPIHAAQKLIHGVTQTPVVDGSGLKNTLERHVVEQMVSELGDEYAQGRVLLTAAVDRYGMTRSFFEAGYDVVCADLMFALGLPFPVRSLSRLRKLARLLLPVVGRMPISMLYPTGERQEQIVPRYEKWYQWATVIAGDCHYIKRHMPESLEGKVIVTNTTTRADMDLFRERGVRHVVTTTPRLDGRSFGTNMMEAALTAVADKQRALTNQELDHMLRQLDLKPSIHNLQRHED